MRHGAAATYRTYLIAAAAAVLAIGVLALTARLLWDGRNAAMARAGESLANLALSLEHDIARNVEIYRLSLRATADGLRLVDGAGMDDRTERAVLFDGAAAAEHFGPILVTDAAGTVIRDSQRSAPIAAVNLADRSYFQRHMDDPDPGVILTFLPLARYNAVPILAISMRVNRPDGTFDGVAVGTIRLNYFRNVFSKFELGRSGLISLHGLDGQRIAGIPDTAQGQSILPAVFQYVRGEGPGTFETADPTDGSSQIVVARKLDHLPLYLVVSRSAKDVLADWRSEAWVIGGWLAAAVLSALALGVALRRELRRRRAAEQAARSAELSARSVEIVAQQQAQAARASEAKLAVYFKHLADGVMAIRILPGRLMIERANAAAQAALGLPPDYAGRDAAVMLSRDDAQLLAGQVRRCVDSGLPVQFAAVRNGRDLRFALAPVRDEPCGEYPDGCIALVLASLRDVTQQSGLEAQLRQAQRMEAVGQLTAGVAHDFNNLLQAQLGSLELLLDEVSDRPQAKAYAQMAIVSGERAAQLTSSLLSFSRKQVLRPEPVAVPALLSGLDALLSRTLDPQIRLRIDVEAELPCVTADPAQLEAALLNLCLNARDAMQEGGGRLLVEAYDGSVALDAPDRLDGGEFVVLAVTDEGRGMPAEVLARACEPFFTTKGVGKGSGLGLSMVQGFAHQSGGELKLQSWPGIGTRIELWLPRSDSQPAAAPACRRARGAGRVLLVDDEPNVLMVLGETLGAAGFRVTEAANGAEALALLTRFRFDALVTDFAMPGMNGAELVRAAFAVRPALPTLVITGYADGAMLDDVPAHVQVVHKPFRSDALVRRLCDLIERRHSPVLADEASLAVLPMAGS